MNSEATAFSRMLLSNKLNIVSSWEPLFHFERNFELGERFHVSLANAIGFGFACSSHYWKTETDLD